MKVDGVAYLISKDFTTNWNKQKTRTWRSGASEILQEAYIGEAIRA